jgi:hypothetical protein
MSSIVSTDILFFVLPSSPPAEKANGSKPAAIARIMAGAPHAGLSSDKYRPCRHGCWRAPADRPTCRIPQPSSVMPCVPLRVGGFGPSDENHAQAADTDSSQPPSWLRAAANGISGEIVPVVQKMHSRRGPCNKADARAAEGSRWPFATATLLLKAPSEERGFFRPGNRLVASNCCAANGRLRRASGKQPSVDA